MRLPFIRCSATVLAFALCSTAAAQVGIDHLYLDPLVVELHGGQAVSLRVETRGGANSVMMVYADGATVPLTAEGDGVFSIVIPHEQAVAGYTSERVHNHYVGHLDFGTGSQANVYVAVDDGSIPRVAVEPRGDTGQASPRVFNLMLPEPVHLVDPGVPEGIARRFYERYPDDYDFINIVDADTEYRAPFFRHAKNDVAGLGLALFDSTSHFGSLGRLEGVLAFPNPSLFDAASPLYLRHLGYRWMNYSDHWKLADASPHWPISEMARGIMGYQATTSIQHRSFPYFFRKQMAGNFLYQYWTGNYFLFPEYDPVTKYGAIELYLMGLVAADDIRDWGYLVPSDQNQEVCPYCVLEKPFEVFSVQDLIDREGPRAPDHNASRKQFRAATVVVSTGRLLSDLEMAFFDLMAARGEGTGELPYTTGFVMGTASPFRDATYGLASLSLLMNPELQHAINHAVSDAWYDPETPGQGIFIDVLAETGRIFMGWFTYETWRPRILEHQLGDEYHRWLTAEGVFSGPRAELTLFETTGGLFGSDGPVSTNAIGNAVFTLRACGHATLELTLDSISQQGRIDLQRVGGENTERCEALQGGTDFEPVVEATADDGLPFQIDAGLSGAWFNPEWTGQGLTLTVLPESEQLFLAWYTFDLERPDESAYYQLGDPGQRWLTAQGEYEGDRADLTLYVTSGGAFLSPYPTTGTEPYGTLTLEFQDCTHATARYEIPALSLAGAFPIVRISDENASYCGSH